MGSSAAGAAIARAAAIRVRDIMKIPRDPLPDSTLRLLLDPYRMISRRCDALGSDVFATRLLLERTVCMRGREAAAVFYDPQRFKRHGAMPARIRRTLLGEGGVQGLDGEQHRHRKSLFMDMMSPSRIDDLLAVGRNEWRRASTGWRKRGEIVLFEEFCRLFALVGCAWAGVPIDPDDPRAAARIDDLRSLFDGAGAVGPRHFAARRARRRADAWAGRLIDDLREGRIESPHPSAALSIASHRDESGKLLPTHTAAVELLNVIRPITAIAVYATLAAHAMIVHAPPGGRQALREPALRRAFTQEVRRFYPFFPAVAARVRTDFDWSGMRFERETLVLLDLFGTDRDPRLWDAPDRFDPERFVKPAHDPFSPIPQGGGTHRSHHRCAGEWITIALLDQAIEQLASGIEDPVRPQDLSLDWRRVPALPHSRVRIVARDAVAG